MSGGGPRGEEKVSEGGSLCLQMKSGPAPASACRQKSYRESFPESSLVLFFKGSLVDLLLRASNDHCFTVGVPRAGRRPGCPSHPSSRSRACVGTLPIRFAKAHSLGAHLGLLVPLLEGG